MARQRSPNRDKALEIFKEHDGNITNRAIAEMLGVPEKTISGWKVKDKWNGVLQKNIRSTPKTKGGQPGNKNAVGDGAPKANKNAEKHGLFSKYLPAETMELVTAAQKMDPLDVLWDQITIQYAAIIRSQQIMHVKDIADSTTTKISESFGKVESESWEVQQAWDKQANYLKAQSRAMATLNSMIKNYDELLHKNWELATEEQKQRIENLKANTAKIKGDDPEDNNEDDGFMKALEGKVDEVWQE